MRKQSAGLLALVLACSMTITLFADDTVMVSRPAGFVRVPLPSMGRALASTPFHAFDPEIPAILGDQLVGGSDPEHSDNILKWDAAQQAYLVFWKNERGEWLQVPSSVLSTNQLTPGEGFWVVNRQLYSQTLYLSGEVVLDDDYSVLLTESLNLLAYPYSASIALNDTTLAKDGALGGTEPSESDIITETLEQQNYWLLNDPTSPYDGKWLDDNNLLSQEKLNPGRAYWYNRKDHDALVWTENRPYEDPFSENGCPQILDITPDNRGRDVTLRISAAECSKSVLEIYYQDIETTGRFSAVSGWKLAAEGIRANGEEDVIWTDQGSSDRDPAYEVHSRIYLAARGDIDLNRNGVSDAREVFVYGKGDIAAEAMTGQASASAKTGGRKCAGNGIPLDGRLAAGGAHSLYIQESGLLFAWGSNGDGQLGINSTDGERLTAAGVGTEADWGAVAAGAAHSLARKEDGTVYAWGDNRVGQLGDRTQEDRYLPVPVRDTTGMYRLSGVQAVACGAEHSLALLDSGNVLAWGSGKQGKLGTSEGRLPKVLTYPHMVLGGAAGGVYLDGISAIAAGSDHSMALNAGGLVYAWGKNGSGQLGDGTIDWRATPVSVLNLVNVTAIDAGKNHSLALDADGHVWAWGDNLNGQLGMDLSTLEYSTLPVLVAGLSDKIIIAIAAGEDHNLALADDGTVWAWGNNSGGCLGDGTTVLSYQPVQVVSPNGTGFLEDIVAIDAGAGHSMALDANELVYTWGKNGSGELGKGDTQSSSIPVLIDSDGDGLADPWEFLYFGNLAQSADGDYDSDGLTNAEEQALGTNPTLWDTDDDGYTDGFEVQRGTNPLDRASFPTGSISGTVTYSGEQAGPIWVKATPGETTWITDFSVQADEEGNYTIENVPLLKNWWIRAWKDADGSGEPDICEPQGKYPESIYLEDDIADVDISLEDDVTPPFWSYFKDVSTIECDISDEPLNTGIPAITDDRSTVSDEGLIAHYSFDNYVSGNPLADDSGEGNDGIVYGNPQIVEGKKGSALQFNGSNYVNIGDLSAVEGKYALTWGGWVYPTGNGLYGVLGKMTSYNGSFYLVLDSRNPEAIGLMLVTETPYSGLTIQIPGFMQLDTWQHVMGTYDGRQVKMYFNGELIGTTSYDDYDDDAAIRANDVVAAIADSSVGRGWRFRGKLDELRIYDRALAADEIRTLYRESAQLTLTYTDAAAPKQQLPEVSRISRTWTATDACGNTDAKMQTIIVQDTTPPVFDIPPPSRELSCIDSTHPDQTGWPVVSDNCDYLSLPTSKKVWINEIHYDNAGDDAGEFIEVAGEAGTDLSEYSLVLYNGSGGTVYQTIHLSGILGERKQECGLGAASFTAPGLQNGSPDGVALCRGTEVLQFLSYEGTFTAIEGPAATMASTDIEVIESSTTPVGFSLQLKGTGLMNHEFVWSAPSDASPGVLNEGQEIEPCGLGEMTLSYHDVTTGGSCPAEKTITRTWTATDSGGNSATYDQTLTVVDNEPPSLTVPADVTIECDQSTGPEVTGYATAIDECQLAGLMPNEIAWINEFHYDNSGTDSGEFVEVAGLAGVNLGEYTLVLYNGANGLVYDTIQLSGIIDNEGCGYGALAFDSPALQNGSPDGLALCLVSSKLIQFLSYEGALTAIDGPAQGQTSVNIGVYEGSGTTLGYSLQLTGEGRGYSAFTWQTPRPSSRGNLNDGQTILSCSAEGLTLTHSDAVTESETCPQAKTITRTWTASDECGKSVSLDQTITVQDTTDPVFESQPADLVLSCMDSTDPDQTGWPVVSDNCDILRPSGNEILWINELHYDNADGDVNEAVEVAGLAGTDLSEYSIVLYNGNGSVVYDTIHLAGVVDDEGCGYGAVEFYRAGIQNGSPDGLALCRGSEVLQFLSYEGTITAVDGPASGQTSVNIGKTEPYDTPIGHSLQLKGSGQMYRDFGWAVPEANTFGSLNADQAISPCGVGGMTLTYNDVVNVGNCPAELSIVRTWTAVDSCGNNKTYTQNITVVDDVPPVLTVPESVSLGCYSPTDPEFMGRASAVDNCQLAGLMPTEIVWINEFHYDNAGTDGDEFIEIAGLAGVSLADYSLVLYNGANGEVYATRNLSGIIDNEGCGYGAVAFDYPVNGIQNGDPDGLALCLMSSELVQFLSYEGSITAANGPAAGTESTEIPVSESSGTPLGYSLQLKGAGQAYGDFVWNLPSPASPGDLNADQVIDPCSPVGITITHLDDVTDGGCPGKQRIVRTWTALDVCGNATSGEQIIEINDSIPPVIVVPPDITVDCGSTDPTFTGEAVAYDNCGGGSLSYGLKVYYPFDNAQDAFADYSEPAHDAIPMGAEYTPDGHMLIDPTDGDGAAYFDGDGSYVYVGDLGTISEGTIAFWMNGEVVENYRNPFTTDYAGWDDCIRFEEYSTGEFVVGALGLSSPGVYTVNMQADQWYHVVFSWDQNSAWGYFNGQKVFGPLHHEGVYPPGMNLNFTRVAIGNGYSTALNRYWKGRMDEVRIYERTLTDDEVGDLYAGTESGNEIEAQYSDTAYFDELYRKIITRTWTAEDECGNEDSEVQTITVKACDADGDGLPDEWETLYGLDPNDPNGDNGMIGDPDKDRLNNLGEYQSGTDPRDYDTDDDLLADGPELTKYSTSPKKADTDEDGASDALDKLTTRGDSSGLLLSLGWAYPPYLILSGVTAADIYEFYYATEVVNGNWYWMLAETAIPGEADGTIEFYENASGPGRGTLWNPAWRAGVAMDSDGDGLGDSYEVIILGTSPDMYDSSQPPNGVSDGDEDFDGDGKTNLEEYNSPLCSAYDPCIQGSSDPWDYDGDTDNDGVSDGPLAGGPDAFPLDPAGAVDTDCDGMPNELNPAFTSNSGPPLQADPDDDNDGLPDVWEEQYGLDSLDGSGVNGPYVDTDMDGVVNADEYQAGTDPAEAYFVSAEAPDGGNGIVSMPFNKIQDAIDAARPSIKRVVVLPGTYAGERNKDLSFGADMFVGGLEGAENTIVDCGESGRGFVFNSGETRDSVLKGFTIRNGCTDNGGGILCTNPGSPTLESLIIEDNTATGNGGGIALYGASPKIVDCIVRRNQAGLCGGGMHSVADRVIKIVSPPEYYYVSTGSSPDVERTLFSHNSTDSSEGTAVYVEDTPPSWTGSDPANHHRGIAVFSKCRFEWNTSLSPFPRSTIYAFWNAKTLITNCAILRNRSRGIGNLYSYMWLNNSVVAYNIFTTQSSSKYGSGIYAVHGYDYPGETEIRNSIIRENLPVNDQIYASGDAGENCSASWSCVDTTTSSFPANKVSYDGHILVADPLLCRDGHLQKGSPCIGKARSATSAADDIDDESRGPAYDMGLDQYLDDDADGLANWWEVLYGYDPAVANDTGLNQDNDDLTDLQEYIAGTDPTLDPGDSDKDGLRDDYEVFHNSDPFDSDTDNDGLNDGAESSYNTDLLNPDTDGDYLPDGWEALYGLDPMDAAGINGSSGDYDGDGYDNYTEYAQVTDPTVVPDQVASFQIVSDCGYIYFADRKIAKGTRYGHLTEMRSVWQDQAEQGYCYDTTYEADQKFYGTASDTYTTIYREDVNKLRVIVDSCGTGANKSYSGSLKIYRGMILHPPSKERLEGPQSTYSLDWPGGDTVTWQVYLDNEGGGGVFEFLVEWAPIATDLDIGEVPEEDELTKGGIIAVNSDNDLHNDKNGDGKVDELDADCSNEVIDGPDDKLDMTPLLLQLGPDELPDASSVRLQVSDKTKIRIFDHQATSVIGPNGEDFWEKDLSEIGLPNSDLTFLAEGVDSGVVMIDLIYKDINGTEVNKDTVKLTIIKVDLDIGSVDDADEESVGGFVPVNADNDNGSTVTDHIPATRDFDTDGYTDDDLVSISLSLEPTTGLSGTLRLRKAEGGRDRIKVWETTGKATEVTLPKTWTVGTDTIPTMLQVEGLKEGEALREVDLILEYLEGGAVVCDDTVKATVTPVLQDLEVTVAAGADPDLVNDPVLGWAIVSEAGGTGSAFTLKAEAFKANVDGELKHVQNVKNVNNLASATPPMAAGAILDDGTERLWDFAAPNAGNFLLDVYAAGDFPFYALMESRTSVGDVETVEAEDSPALSLTGPVNSVLPAAGDTTQVDVSFEFQTFATWKFDDDTVYFLGKTTWNLRYAGDISRPAGGGNPTFAKGANNNNNGSTVFTRSNSNPPATSAPTANAGSAGWR